MKKIFNVLLLFVFLFAFTLSQSLNLDEPFDAKTLKVSGNVLLKRAQAIYWDNVEEDTIFFAQDQIKTLTGSFCELLLKDGHIMHLEDNSELIISEYQKDQKKWNTFKMSVGKLWVQVVKGVESADNFTLETPQATISVKGTFFLVSAPFGPISTFEGAVNVFKDGTNLLLNRGFEAFISSAEGLGSASALSAESLQAFKAFAGNTTIPSQILQQIQQELTPGLLNPTNLAETGIIAPATTLPEIKAPNIQNQALQTNSVSNPEPIQEATNSPTQPDTASPPKINRPLILGLGTSSLIPTLKKSNPSLLSLQNQGPKNSIYYKINLPNNLATLQNDLNANTLNTDKTIYNQGLHNLLKENQYIGMEHFTENDYSNVFFQKHRHIVFYPNHPYTNISNIFGLNYSKNLSLFDKIHSGISIKTLFVNMAEGTSSYPLLQSNYESLYSTELTVNNLNEFHYGFDFGLALDINDHFTLGASLENFLNSAGIRQVVPLEKRTSAQAIFHLPDLVVNTQLSLPENTAEYNEPIFFIQSSFRCPDFWILNNNYVKLSLINQNKAYSTKAIEGKTSLGNIELIAEYKIEDPIEVDKKTLEELILTFKFLF